uniref:Uncharacterized protein n=1 Tax=Proboscia inermis TaxID=420281 RepID=A0A7S0C9J9_9STRA|mmetsp:Transcript_35740/g.35938  ORF Transcript_35740/g.35938 Transcript_35740/m.35938 type:complete len:103 (+) Transcript_35740:489-797(+)
MAVALSPALDDVVISWKSGGDKGGQQAPLVQGKLYLAYFLPSPASSLVTSESNASLSLLSTSELSVTINAYDIASEQTHEYEVLTKDMIVVTGLYNGNMIHN